MMDVDGHVRATGSHSSPHGPRVAARRPAAALLPSIAICPVREFSTGVMRMRSGSSGHGRLSHIPLIIEPAEWKQLEAGLVQRTDLLKAVLTITYGPTSFSRDGHLPAALIAGNPGSCVRWSAFTRPPTLPTRSAQSPSHHHCADVIRATARRLPGFRAYHDFRIAQHRFACGLCQRLSGARRRARTWRDCREPMPCTPACWYGAGRRPARSDLIRLTRLLPPTSMSYWRSVATMPMWRRWTVGSGGQRIDVAVSVTPVA